MVRSEGVSQLSKVMADTQQAGPWQTVSWPRVTETVTGQTDVNSQEQRETLTCWE